MAKRCRVSLSDPLLERSEGMPLSDRERAEGFHQTGETSYADSTGV